MNFPANSPQARRAARIELLFPLEYPADLPVVLRREDLAEAIARNQVVIVCGETGSGKTTQLPKICLSIGRGVQGMIAHTQPRRVAARSVANRIAHELKTELGGVVGFKVRFNDKVSEHTCIKLMTDGILLAEIHSDPLLKKYDTIIIDEAHERSLNIDFLLGYFKQLLPRRPDLKLIITSATLDAERFARHFESASSLTVSPSPTPPPVGEGLNPLSHRGRVGEGVGVDVDDKKLPPIIQVSGRSYPVEIRYRPPQHNEEGEIEDIPQAVCTALDELSIGGLRGDVLVFLPGEREIRDTAEALRKHHPRGVEILPLFSRLSAAEQDRVFKPASGMRRVVLATNVAETSLTVPNIGYVIDSGQARINRYSIRQKVEQLRVEKISRAAASQRAGRCGRVMSGICVRLYDEANFNARAEYTDAEIFRVSLATVILRMSALGLGEVEQFPFIEPPGSRSIADGYQLLIELGAIAEGLPPLQPSDELTSHSTILPNNVSQVAGYPGGRGGEPASGKNNVRQLTPLGYELAKLPLDPKIARLLLAGRQYHCLQEILIIASALALQDPRDRPLERREAADAAHQRFNDERSDFLAYLKLWAWFQEAVKHKKSNRLWTNECREKFLSPLRLREWHELHQQLHAQVAEMGMLGCAAPSFSPSLALPRGEMGLAAKPPVQGNGISRREEKVGTHTVSVPLASPLSHRGRAREGANPKHNAALPEAMLTHARELRKNATDAENLLWQLLRRNYVLGFGFRRQHPLGKYILDFYCHQAKLTIELDGGQHAEDTQRRYDEARSGYLKAQGITVLRFWNNEVLTNLEGVLQSLFLWLSDSPSLTLPRWERGLEANPLNHESEVSRSAEKIITAKASVPQNSPLSHRGRAREGELLTPTKPATYEQIHKALLTGLLGNIGCKSIDREPYYLGAREIKFFIAPNSVLAKKGAKWVVAAELTETTKLYARCVARIEPEWLEEIGAYLIRRHYFDPHWEKKAAQVAAWERSTLYGLVINPKKRVNYGPMNVPESREVFIRQALVAGEFNTLAPFFAHNQKLIQDIEALEHKARRPDVLVDDELIFAFYDHRIPPHIHNGAAFEAWRKEAEREQPRLLFLKKDDLMRHEAAGITTNQFPPQMVMNNISYALAYHFSPGKSDDGVTITVPLALINQLSAPRCEYLVPGLLAEKVTQLVKTLPQKLRRHLVPVPEFAAAFCREVEPADTPLLQALARYIRAQKQFEVPLDAFRLEQLPLHLKMNFHVVDEHGRQLGVSRNFMQLRGEFVSKRKTTPSPTLPRWERGLSSFPASLGLEKGLSPSPTGGGVGEGESVQQPPTRFTDWSFGNFKPTSEVTRAGQTVTLFNALVDEGEAVALQAFDTRDEAQAAHRKGLVRLFMLALKEQVKFLEKNLSGMQAMGMQFLPFGSQQDLQRQIFSVTFDRCCLMDPWPTGENEFAARCKEAKSRLTLVAQEIARLVGSILTEYQVLQKSLPGFKAHLQAVQDIRAQCEWMLGKEWIARTPYERLQHVPRYLKAINVRLEKLRANPARDAQQLAQMQSLQQMWQRRMTAQHTEVDTRVADFGWLLQELRVSLFAQELKTPVIVSVKRLQKMWETM